MSIQHKFDGHIHTAETSACGYIPAAEVVDMYYELGYSGIAITDHLHEEYISTLDCRDNWDACVDHFLSGYKKAKKRGDEIGLNVVLGAELRYYTVNENDYLVYGIDEQFLRHNPYPFRLGPHGFYEKFGGQVLIIHAHPYRNGVTEVFRECVHGVELINGNIRHKNYNEKALELCKANPGLYIVCSSDTHQEGDEGRAWILLDEPAADSYAYKAAIESGKYLMDCSTSSEDRELIKLAQRLGV